MNVLDPCCGTRQFHFDRQNPSVLYGDVRRECVTVTDRTHHDDGTRLLEIKPDAQMDFRALPFSDATFRVVVFDPPHLVRAGRKSWMAAKYGKLSSNWRADLTLGFSECFRVLMDYGTLIFKWSETQISTNEVLALTPNRPLVGHQSGKRSGTHWFCFLKEPS